MSKKKKKNKVEILKSASIVILLIISFYLYYQKPQPNLEAEIKRLKEQLKVKENGKGGNINSEEIKRLETENEELQKKIIQNLELEAREVTNRLRDLYNFARRDSCSKKIDEASKKNN